MAFVVFGQSKYQDCGVATSRKVNMALSNSSHMHSSQLSQTNKKPLYNAKFTHRKIPICPGLIFVQRAISVGLFSEGLIIEMNFAFQSGLDLTIKTA